MRKRENIKKTQPDDLKDPYLTATDYKDMSVCRVCHDIYHNKRWIHDEALYDRLVRNPAGVNFTVCPSCKKIENHYYEGVVELSGDFLFEHKDEILHLIRNTENRADYINPQEKIENLEIDDANKLIRLTTTSEDLAQRIGKNIESAYDGNLQLSFSEDDRLVRVYWSR